MQEDTRFTGQLGPHAPAWPTPATGLSRHVVTASGHQMSYVTGGSGPPMVLLHGLGANSFTWRYVLPTLMQHYTIFAPDMFGCGDSDKANVDFSLHAMAGYVNGFMEAVGLDRAIFVGHSLGGGLTMQYCHEYPGHAERIVLVSSGGLGTDLHWLLRISTLPGANGIIGAMADPRTRLPQLSRTMEQRRLHRLDQEFDPDTQTMLDRFQSYETRQAFLSMLRHVGGLKGQRLSALAHLGELTVPVLLIWGARDSTIPVSHGRHALSFIPFAHLEVLPNCYHRPQIEAPRRFNELILDFLRAETWPPEHADEPGMDATWDGASSGDAIAIQPGRWQITANTWRKLAPALALVALAALTVPTGMLMRSRARRRQRLSL